MTVDVMTSDDSRPAMPMNKKIECKDHQIYSKIMRKICKKDVYSQFRQSHKKFIFWSTFSVY